MFEEENLTLNLANSFAELYEDIFVSRRDMVDESSLYDSDQSTDVNRYRERFAQVSLSLPASLYPSLPLAPSLLSPCL